MGPNNIGGRTLAILFDPNNSSRMWAGTETGGLWVSYDEGAHWSVVQDFMPSLGITSLAADPMTGYFYAGTGDAGGVPDDEGRGEAVSLATTSIAGPGFRELRTIEVVLTR